MDRGPRGRPVTDARRSSRPHALRPAGHLLGRPAGESLCQIVRRLRLPQVRNGGTRAAGLDRGRCPERTTEWTPAGRGRPEVNLAGRNQWSGKGNQTASIGPAVGASVQCNGSGQGAGQFVRFFAGQWPVRGH
uniref:(northern house mosquito) hypothetical protein n=1 Tax=Culex pipiens TaxID=7175 RepID=A0A8D8BNV8_CULPI